jgi:hypothetical protein
MLESFLTALSTIANAKGVLELTSGVARFILRKTKRNSLSELTPLSLLEERALEATYKEWEHIAISLEPAIETVMERESPTSLSDRAELLANLAKAYAADESRSQPDTLKQLSLRHTAFTYTTDGAIHLKFGLSDQTKCLSGEAINIPLRGVSGASFNHLSDVQPHSHKTDGGQMPLPVFKVTMLGDSGSGKTVFMSSMYSKMRLGDNGIAIRAISHDVNLDLGQNIENLYGHHRWPTTNEGKEINYEFELSLQGHPIAVIDWVDYRGGAIWERQETPEGQALIKSLQNSHSIIWMVDMSKLGEMPPDSFQARTLTKIGHMANLCRSAAGGKRLRSILFVRTKSDEVQGTDGRPDWGRACDDLVRHLGPVINFDRIPFAALIPVSSVGRVKEEKKLAGDDPYNVEWPLILSLAFMMEADLERLRLEAAKAKGRLDDARPFEAFKIFKEILRLGMSDAEQEALQKFSEISRQVIGMGEVIKELVSHKPSTIKLIRKQQP